MSKDKFKFSGMLILAILFCVHYKKFVFQKPANVRIKERNNVDNKKNIFTNNEYSGQNVKWSKLYYDIFKYCY